MTSAVQRLAARRAAAAARPAVDLADLVASPVLDQGPRPTCVPCALAAAHEAERTLSGFKAAVEPIWWHLHGSGEASERGTTLAASGVALSTAGHCDASLWPYNPLIGFETEPLPAAVHAPPWTLADLVPLPLAHDGVEDNIEQQLAAGHPVVLVIEVTDEFFDPEPDGYVRTPMITTPAAGYHAVLVVGAWTDPIRGRIFLIRNSWGVRWGSEGYCTVSVEYLIAFAVQAARVQIPPQTSSLE